MAEIGFWERSERLVLMILAAVTNRMEVALWILAIGPNITVVHRILHTWKQTKTKQEVSYRPSPRDTIVHDPIQSSISRKSDAVVRAFTRAAGRNR